jgi:hypothetical protein
LASPIDRRLALRRPQAFTRHDLYMRAARIRTHPTFNCGKLAEPVI